MSTALQGSERVYLGDLLKGLCSLLVLIWAYLQDILAWGSACPENHLSPLVKQQAVRIVDFAFG